MNNELIERIDTALAATLAGEKAFAKHAAMTGSLTNLAALTGAVAYNRGVYGSLRSLLQDCKAALTQQQEAEPVAVDDEAMFEWVYAQATASLRRHNSAARGQQITRADGADAHLIWAALRWAELHPPKPAAQHTEDLEFKCKVLTALLEEHIILDAEDWDEEDWFSRCEAAIGGDFGKAYNETLERAKQAAQPQVPDEKKLAEWLEREMPAGTIIGNPSWWAPRIIKAISAAKEES